VDALVLQLADAAFPSGGFAHSAGLEVAAQLGEVNESAAFLGFVRETCWQAGYGSVPLVAETCRQPGALAACDAACDAFLIASVANRASRTQGRAFIAACSRSFDEPAIARLHEDVRDGRLRGHHAPLFGVTAATVGLSPGDALLVWMHQTVRAVLSAAVRLGIVGAHEAQSIHRATAPLRAHVVAECGALGLDDLAQTSPRFDVVAAQHDGLYSRLFQS
jgi:urease accessory protein